MAEYGYNSAGIVHDHHLRTHISLQMKENTPQGVGKGAYLRRRARKILSQGRNVLGEGCFLGTEEVSAGGTIKNGMLGQIFFNRRMAHVLPFNREGKGGESTSDLNESGRGAKLTGILGNLKKILVETLPVRKKTRGKGRGFTFTHLRAKNWL